MTRTIHASELKLLIASSAVAILDVRRLQDYEADSARLPGAVWKNPEQVAEWGKALPKDREVIIYCARGGSVSNSVLNSLLAHDVQARFIEGGIEGWKAAGGATVPKP